jgi:membrane protease YdiL (CAAX protease family)
VSETTPKRWRVWVALVLPNFILALCALPLVAYLMVARELRGDALRAAIEERVALPALVGFGLIFALVRALARRDGWRLADLGWTRFTALDGAIGAGLAVLIAALNQWLLYPLVMRFQPSFEPTVPRLGLLEVTALGVGAIVAEDTLYRGYALRALRERHGVGVAVAVTTLFYAVLSPPGIALKLWAFGFGLLLVALRLWRGSLWPVALVHLLVAIAPKAISMLK